MNAGSEDWLALLGRVREGDRIALARVTALVTGTLARMGAYELRDSWDDVCQEVLLKLLRADRDGSIRDPRAFVAYTGTVTRRALLDWLRKDAQGVGTEPLADDDGREGHLERAVDPLEAAPDPDLRLDLERALDALPAVQRRVLDAVYLEGRSYEEAARKLDMPLGTLKRHQTGGLEELRQRMGVTKGKP
jgi:RNA polymerase sigma-70 factor (ECF subfamily)